MIHTIEKHWLIPQKNKQILAPVQNIVCFGLFRFIVFVTAISFREVSSLKGNFRDESSQYSEKEILDTASIIGKGSKHPHTKKTINNELLGIARDSTHENCVEELT
jgi:hypothetical protein